MEHALRRVYPLLDDVAPPLRVSRGEVCGRDGVAPNAYAGPQVRCTRSPKRMVGKATSQQRMASLFSRPSSKEKGPPCIPPASSVEETITPLKRIV